MATAANEPASRRGETKPSETKQRAPGPVLMTAAAYAWRLLVIALALYVAGRVLGHLMTLVIPIAVALLVTALLRPMTQALRRHHVPHWLATVIALVLAVVVIGGILGLVVTRAVEQAPQLAKEINQLIPKIQRWLITGPLHLDPTTVNSFSTTLTKAINKNSSAIAATALSTGKTVLDLIAGFLIAVFATIFFVHDGERIWTFVTKVVPTPGRHRFDLAGRESWTTLRHYVRGTLIVAVFHGVVISVVLTALGVPLVIPLALLVAIGSFVPIVGSLVTGVLAVGVAGLSQGLVGVIVVAAVLILDSQVESHALQPFVVGRYVRIHPLAVVVVLAAGSFLLGIFGAVIAVPLTACLNTAVRSLTRRADRPPLDLADK